MGIKKNLIKIYELDDNGNYILKDRVNNKDEYITDTRISHLSRFKVAQNDGIPEAIIKYASSNPFLFQKNKENEYAILSIEDFRITLTNRDCFLGDVLRTNDYTKKEKKQIFKKTLQNWKNDFIDKCSNVYRESEVILNQAVNGELKKTPFLYIVFALASIIMALVVFFGLINIFKSLKKEVIITCVIVSLLALSGLITSSIRVGISKKYDIEAKRNKEIFYKNKKELEKKFKKNYNIVKKYYSDLGQNFMKPMLPISNVMVGGEKLDEIITITNEQSKRSLTINYTNEKITFLYNYPIIVSTISFIVCCGYYLYKVVNYLIKLIF